MSEKTVFDLMDRTTSRRRFLRDCHILPHAESDHGMFGMVTALVIQA
jgi:hypothetical protein